MTPPRTDQIDDLMNATNKTTQLQGIVLSQRYNRALEGKQFLGVAIQDDEGNVWVVDYEEQSPYHAFARHRVVALGEAYEPGPLTQHLIGWHGARSLGHFQVSTMKLAEITSDAEVVEVGPRQTLRGQLERHAISTGKSILTFVTEEGEAFVVANDPAGSNVGARIEVSAYAVYRSASAAPSSGRLLWVIGPYSMADLWKWRERT
jgi:hypothetical protein